MFEFLSNIFEVMMTEATVYEEQNQCRHVNQQSCFNAYKTVYKTTQVCNPETYVFTSS